MDFDQSIMIAMKEYNWWVFFIGIGFLILTVSAFFASSFIGVEFFFLYWLDRKWCFITGISFLISFALKESIFALLFIFVGIIFAGISIYSGYKNNIHKKEEWIKMLTGEDVPYSKQARKKKWYGDSLDE